MNMTRTYGKLHFDDIDPSRFEDLTLAMIYKSRRWFSINSFGRSGNDDGVDIQSVEELENGVKRTWFIQCKRYLKLSSSGLKQIIDTIIKNNSTKPDILLVVVSCNVSKNSIESYQQYAKNKGINSALIWDAAVLETMLYSEFHDLLFAYFGVNLNFQRKNKIETIRRNIGLKQQIKKDFLKKNINPSETIKRPFLKFAYNEAIIHSIDDDKYPKVDNKNYGISSWYKVEIYNFYHNGIEVIIGAKKCVIFDEWYWDIIEDDDSVDNEKFKIDIAYEVGRIPFENIIAYDIDGDEFYPFPHIYCDFKYSCMPYEEIRYYYVGDYEKSYIHDILLENDMRKNIEK